MIYVVVEELIPEAQSGEHSNISTVALAIGLLCTHDDTGCGSWISALKQSGNRLEIIADSRSVFIFDFHRISAVFGKVKQLGPWRAELHPV